MYGIFGKMLAHPGKRDELLQHFLGTSGDMLDMEGNYLYVINTDPTDPDAIWIYEAWRSQADHQASLQNPAVINLIAAARPLIAGFGERFEVTPLGGKGLHDIPA
jgi:quinol monooxygenase YgiN